MDTGMETIKRQTRTAYGRMVIGQSVGAGIACMRTLSLTQQCRCRCGIRLVALHKCYMSLPLPNPDPNPSPNSTLTITRDQLNSRFHGRNIFREIGLLP